MKKLIATLVFTFILSQLWAQQEIVFKIKYLPNHHYKSIMSMVNNGEVLFKGTQQQLDEIKSSGANNQMKMVGTMTAEYNIKTGATDSERGFPLVINYTKLENKQLLDGKELPLPKSDFIGKAIYAHSDFTGVLKMDSLSGTSEKKDSLLRLAGGVLQAMSSQIKFPEKGLKIGESFEKSMPLNLPILGNNVPVAMKLNYKLINVQQDIAFFDIDQTVSFTMNLQQGTVDIKGNGKGKLQFSIKDSFPLEYTSDVVLKYTMNVSGLPVEGSSSIKATYNTEIN